MLSDRPTRFELLTAAAFRWFADIAVDVAVVEVGLGGRWDATNVVAARGGRGDQRQLRPRRGARSDAASTSRRRSRGSSSPAAGCWWGRRIRELRAVFVAAADAVGAETWVRGPDFACDRQSGGRGGPADRPPYPGGRVPRGLSAPARGPSGRERGHRRGRGRSLLRSAAGAGGGGARLRLGDACPAGWKWWAAPRWSSSTAPTTWPAPTALAAGSDQRNCRPTATRSSSSACSKDVTRVPCSTRCFRPGCARWWPARRRRRGPCRPTPSPKRRAPPVSRPRWRPTHGRRPALARGRGGRRTGCVVVTGSLYVVAEARPLCSSPSNLTPDRSNVIRLPATITDGFDAGFVR